MAKAEPGVTRELTAEEIRAIVYDRAGQPGARRVGSQFYKRAAMFAGLATALVIYGSFLPFQLNPQRAQTASLNILSFPCLDVSKISRVDMVANGVLFAGLSFLWCLAVGRSQRPFFSLIAVSLVALFLAGIACAIEIAQQYFTRTVSLNDLASELAGIILGCTAWLLLARKIEAIQLKLAAKSPAKLRARGLLLAVFFGLVSIYPIDLAFSMRELIDAWSGESRIGFFLNETRASARALVAVAAVFVYWTAIGLLLSGDARRARRRQGAVLLALVTFAATSVVDAFTLSGRIDMLNAAAMALGAWTGGRTGPVLDRLIARSRPRNWQGLLLTLGLVHMGILLWLRGYRIQPLPDLSQIGLAFSKSSILPFYFHYMMVSEEVAAISAIRVGAACAPIGALVVLAHDHQRILRHPPLRQAALYGFILAIAVELWMAMFAAMRPDFTNGIFGALGASGAAALLCWYIDARHASEGAAA